MDTKKLDAFLDRLTSWRIPGNDCIIIKDGKTVYRHMSGYADLEEKRKICGNETYNMWSISKPITATAVMTLFERGDILINDPVSLYLPEYANVKVRTVCEDGTEVLKAPSTKLTIRHLLSMSAGFDYDFDTPAIRDVKKNTDGRCPTREVVRAIAESPLHFEPGEHWRYSICHDILGGLVEAVSGERFSDYVKRVIFDPLEMHSSTFGKPSDELLSRMARQYSFNYEKNCPVPTDNSVSHRIGSEYESGGAGLISCVEDYAKFAAMLAGRGTGMNGARILAPATVELIRKNALNETQMKDVNWSQLKGYGYGLGVRTMVDPYDGGVVGEFGWAGAAGSWLMVDPDINLALFYAEHMLESQEEYIAPRLRNIVYSCL